MSASKESRGAAIVRALRIIVLFGCSAMMGFLFAVQLDLPGFPRGGSWLGVPESLAYAAGTRTAATTLGMGLWFLYGAVAGAWVAGGLAARRPRKTGEKLR